MPLAPLLAEAGVHAVLAMQGKVSMDTVKTAMPVFFEEMLRDGQIDRAMARARGRVRDRGDSWMLALFLRLKDGRIWAESPATEMLEGLADWLSDGELPRVEDTDPYRLGATGSDYGGSDNYGERDTYVPRRIDGELRDALQPGRLVLLVGPSKAGKTRTAFEALRSRWGHAQLVVPVVGTLERLAGHTRLRTTASALVIWLDDLNRYLAGDESLTPELLARLTARPGETLVLATLRSEERARLQDTTGEVSRDTRSLLDAAKPTTFELGSTAEDPQEQAAARTAYPDEDLVEVGLAERLAYAPALLQAYDDAAGADPLGHTLIRTAIDWARVGGPEPIPESDLIELARTALWEERPDLDPDEQQTAAALARARTSVSGSGRVAPLGTHALPEHVRGYWPFSYLVAADDGQSRPPRPIPESFWGRIIERIAPADAFAVGIGAYNRDNATAAIAAFEKAADAGNAGAMFNLGLLLAGLEPPQLDAARGWYQKAADAGDTDAMVNLGLMLEQLERPQSDAARAWYRKAADAGDTDAMVNLGNLLARLDPPEAGAARNWYAKAIEAGHIGAMFDLAVLLEHQDPPESDAARGWYQKGADAGHVPAMLTVGNLLFALKPPELDAARGWYQKAADAGQIEAMYNLGNLLAALDPPELDAARDWLEKAADAGHIDAMVNLGNLLMQLEPDEALRWWQTAAEAGDADSMFLLATVAQSMEPPQLDAAFRWYQKAAEAGHINAMVNLGNLLARLDPPEPDAALPWWQKAADAGDADAMFNLGLLAAGTEPPELETARSWWEKAADAGHAEAMFNLGVLHVRLSPPELEAARNWWQKAADAGHAEAMFNLGNLLASREPPELDAARSWYQRAANAGHADAMFNLASLLAGAEPPEARRSPQLVREGGRRRQHRRNVQPREPLCTPGSARAGRGPRLVAEGSRRRPRGGDDQPRSARGRQGPSPNTIGLTTRASHEPRPVRARSETQG